MRLKLARATHIHDNPTPRCAKNNLTRFLFCHIRSTRSRSAQLHRRQPPASLALNPLLAPFHAHSLQHRPPSPLSALTRPTIRHPPIPLQPVLACPNFVIACTPVPFHRHSVVTPLLLVHIFSFSQILISIVRSLVYTCNVTSVLWSCLDVLWFCLTPHEFLSRVRH